jgi:hypothetical protein
MGVLLLFINNLFSLKKIIRWLFYKLAYNSHLTVSRVVAYLKDLYEAFF